MKFWTHYCQTEQQQIDIELPNECDWCGEQPTALDRLEYTVDNLEAQIKNAQDVLEEISKQLVIGRLKIGS